MSNRDFYQGFRHAIQQWKNGVTWEAITASAGLDQCMPYANGERAAVAAMGGWIDDARRIAADVGLKAHACRTAHLRSHDALTVARWVGPPAHERSRILHEGVANAFTHAQSEYRTHLRPFARHLRRRVFACVDRGGLVNATTH